ncbi:hypothetical protein TRIATDRAFT_86132 [Trichoderma atroviride IMI 206040]|uniref:Uncharacterized protein n=1 Tax=Hypocrea atroviridis (strain ATCC 20476 / IMI 206040) TaxID=452589 RepID=G9P3R3_HYPAI|nr:uncharacterized protein TRIATDRAFT_86132 [Trichoderma atroviride IMI 206040]EHK43020.1 hypothetical protein TRIATDRAFT_86132 [Trichoderma atroviride IMI 206040]
MSESEAQKTIAEHGGYPLPTEGQSPHGIFWRAQALALASASAASIPPFKDAPSTLCQPAMPETDAAKNKLAATTKVPASKAGLGPVVPHTEARDRPPPLCPALCSLQRVPAANGGSLLHLWMIGGTSQRSSET